MKNYNDLVTKAREIARDFCRMRAINRIRQIIASLENAMKAAKEEYEKACKSYEKQLADNAKNVARVEYKLTKLDEEDPDFEDKKETLEKQLETAKKTLASCEADDPREELETVTNKEIEAIEKDKKEAEEKIEKIANGEIKIKAENIKEATERVLQVMTNEAARTGCEFSDVKIDASCLGAEDEAAS